MALIFEEGLWVFEMSKRKVQVKQGSEQYQAARLQRSLGSYIIIAAKGFAMGSADVVPGVSGGTMAFILGIYQELIDSIRALGRPGFWRTLIRLQIGKLFEIVNWRFLVALFSGIVVALVTLAPLIEWLLEHQPVYLWSFFFGLVLASVVIVSRKIEHWTPPLWSALLFGAVVAFVVVGLVPVQTPEASWFLILSGILASSAMILPGISGSFILLLIGKYEFVINALNQRDILSLGMVVIGAAVGLITLSQVLGWLFRRYHDLTVAVLAGFMLGSLRKIWPWKQVVETYIDRHGAEVPLIERNVLPALSVDGGFNLYLLAAIGLMTIGILVVLIIEQFGGTE